jgi:hypothetical protein
MKCPKCQAKLLPVDGVMFCLQCGNAVAPKKGADLQGPDILETSDPLLQRAIVDVSGHEVKFKLPHSNVAPPVPVTALTTMKAVLGSPRPVLAVAGGGVLAPPSRVALIPKDKEPAEPANDTKKTRASELNLAITKAPKVRLGAPGWLSLKISPAYMVGAVAFAAFVLVNAGIYGAYAGKIYPGVKVDGVAIGGAGFDEVAAKVNGLTKDSPLTAEIGTRAIQLDTKGLAETNVGKIEREAEQIGHSTPLPLAGLIEAQFSKPIHAQLSFNQAALDKILKSLEIQIDRTQVDAVPVIYNGQAFVVSDKSGEQLEAAQVTSEIKQAYGSQRTVQIKTNKVAATITTSAYANDLADAQTMLSLSLRIQVGKDSYSPTPAQIGTWLGFGAPGKGIVIDQSAVAGYVNGLAGSFDKDSTTKALVAAIHGKQPLAYNAPSKKTPISNFAASVAVPLKTYTYCVTSNQPNDLAAFQRTVAVALGQTPGWTLGGKFLYKAVTSSCNFSIGLETDSQMAALDPTCKGVASCMVGSTLAVNSAVWKKPSNAWKGSVAGYQIELVNHEVGHWLGFEHGRCTLTDASKPVLSQPTITLGGCSPQWYEIPTEVQGTKTLNQL